MKWGSDIFGHPPLVNAISTWNREKQKQNTIKLFNRHYNLKKQRNLLDSLIVSLGNMYGTTSSQLNISLAKTSSQKESYQDLCLHLQKSPVHSQLDWDCTIHTTNSEIDTTMSFVSNLLDHNSISAWPTIALHGEVYFSSTESSLPIRKSSI